MAAPTPHEYDGKVRHLSSPTARLAGFVLMAVGGAAVVSALLDLIRAEATWLQLASGPVLLGVGFLMVSSYEGITLNTRTRRYRNYTWMAGFRRGEWLHLPTVTRILVSPFNSAYVLRDGIAPGMTVQQHGLYRVLLSVENSRVGIVAAIAKQNEALAKAERLSQLLAVELSSTLKAG